MKKQLNKKNPFAASTHLFERIIKRCNLDEFDNLTRLMNAFPHLSIRDGYELDGYNAGDKRDSVMKLYASVIGSNDRYMPVPPEDMKRLAYRQTDSLAVKGKDQKKMPAIKPFKDGQYIQNTIPFEASETVPPLLDYLEFPFTPVAIWEAILITEASRLYLPHTGHGCYNNGMLVVDNTSLFLACSPFDVDYKAFLNDIRIIPSVELISDTDATVRYCYWNEWCGLRRVNFILSRNAESDIIIEMDEETLIDYDSGNRY